MSLHPSHDLSFLQEKITTAPIIKNFDNIPYDFFITIV